MRYHSTRGGSSGQTFEAVVMRGLAPDGGLYIPDTIPTVSKSLLDDWCNLSFTDLAVEILSLYIEDEVPREELVRMAKQSYEEAFAHDLITPVVELTDHIFMLELHHGPTFAFKDVALQFLGNLFEFFLERKRQRGEDVKPITVLGATSGDTGSAAIYGLRGKRNIDVFILHPKGRVAPVQERQMTTVLDPNVHNVAVEGTFDDCQNLVKACFNDRDFNGEYGLAAINSINWARILAQIVYYFHAYGQYRRLTGKEGEYPEAVFCVPTGNFGDVLAGYYAKQMGLPIKRLIVATNANDIVHRFIKTGRMTQKEVTPTIAPAMDIQISSNFERYLFYLCGSQHERLRQLMDAATRGDMAVDDDLLARARKDFASYAAHEDAILSTIKQYNEQHSYVLCPHTACGVVAAEAFMAESADAGTEIICLATAHPAKFNEAVRTAIDKEPSPPPALRELDSLPTRCLTAPNNKAAIMEIVAQHSTRRQSSGAER